MFQPFEVEPSQQPEDGSQEKRFAWPTDLENNPSDILEQKYEFSFLPFQKMWTLGFHAVIISRIQQYLLKNKMET